MVAVGQLGDDRGGLCGFFFGDGDRACGGAAGEEWIGVADCGVDVWVWNGSDGKYFIANEFGATGAAVCDLDLWKFRWGDVGATSDDGWGDWIGIRFGNAINDATEFDGVG